MSGRGSDKARKQAGGPKQRDRWQEATGRGRGDRERGCKHSETEEVGREKRMRMLGLVVGRGTGFWRQGVRDVGFPELGSREYGLETG